MRVRLGQPAQQRPTAAAGYPGPDAVEVGPRSLRVGATLCRTVAVVGYPREVGPAWLEPLLAYPGDGDIALHVEPVPPAVAAQRLRSQLARLESSRRLAFDRGRLEDFEVDAAAEDARDLARQVARGEGRLFRVGLYVTIRAQTENELQAEAAKLRSLLGSLLLDAQPATFRSLQGWITTLPLGIDLLKLRRSFDTSALAASLPFASAELATTGGVLYGRNLQGHGLVLWDRFAQDNYNSVVLARSGAGKSYLTKLELLRWLYAGVEAAVIDPQDEYARLAEAVGGTRIALGREGVWLNPFDLGNEPDALTRRALFVHTLIAVLLGQPPDPAATAALDRAIIAAYAARGITIDPRTHRRPAPLLADLAAALAADRDQAARTMAGRLAPYVRGTHKRLFDGPTSTRPEGHLVVFALRDLPDELAPAGMLLALDTIWRRATDPAHRRRRLVVVDEAWLLLRSQAGARFLYRLAKAGRKHWCGLTTVTQDIDDLLATDLGKAVIANAATQILLGQAPQAIGALTEAFHLSEGERALLLAARRGDGILAAGQQRVAFRAEASPLEHQLATTSPEFPASLQAEKATSGGDAHD
jgi:type IV secretory pathway VirB4 component